MPLPAFRGSALRFLLCTVRSFLTFHRFCLRYVCTAFSLLSCPPHRTCLLHLRNRRAAMRTCASFYCFCVERSALNGTFRRLPRRRRTAAFLPAAANTAACHRHLSPAAVSPLPPLPAAPPATAFSLVTISAPPATACLLQTSALCHLRRRFLPFYAFPHHLLPPLLPLRTTCRSACRFCTSTLHRFSHLIFIFR